MEFDSNLAFTRRRRCCVLKLMESQHWPSAMSCRSVNGRAASMVAFMLLLMQFPALPVAQDSEPGKALAEAAMGRLAHFVSVPLPLSGSADTDVKRRIDQIVTNVGRLAQRPILVLEFQSQSGSAGEASEFERCLSLARYLASDRVMGVRTVAFVPAGVQGHAVLPVLACEEIVISEEAVFGAAGINESYIDDSIRSSYREIAERRRTVPLAVVMGMLDKQLNVYRAQTTEGVRYVLDDELQALQRGAAVSSVETVSRAGDLATFKGRELRVQFGFVSHLAGDRYQLAEVLGLPRGALQQDPSAGGRWRPLRVDVRGPINAKHVNWIERSLRERLAPGDVNLVYVVIDSGGGSLQDSMRLANSLAALDSSQVRTVAYVAVQARSDAALIALGCDQLVLAEDARLGGPGERVLDNRELEAIRSALATLAGSQGREWSLMAAMVDSELAVHRYRHTGTGDVRYFCREELNSQDEPDEWSRESQIDTRDGLTGRTAAELNLAQSTAASMEELARLYHADGELPEKLEPNWAHLLIEQLASPRLAGILLFVAWFALLIELSQPGIGLPGFVSALCFVLYFWSNFLHGTAGWLEVLLFGVGLACVLIELLVLPGVGIFGIGGGFLVLVSIVLASQTFVIPRNSYQLGQVPGSLWLVAAAAGGAFASLVFVRRYLPDAPVLNRMVLAPPDDEEIEEREVRESLVQLDHLIGKRGRTATPLMPSGKARFGDDMINVTSNGEPIPRNVDVVVVANRGNYLLVEPADMHRS